MTEFEPVSRLLKRLGVVFVGSTALLLGFTGVGFADESADIQTAGASATVNVDGTGIGASAQISVSNVQLTGPGCYYVKYDLKIQGGFDEHGKHVGDDFCSGEENTDRSVEVTKRVGLIPEIEGAAVRMCENLKGEADSCGEPIYLEAWGHNPLRP
jgi:hypothetical protein